MLDLAIRGGSVIDGRGGPARAANLGIREGRIAAVGELDEPARETLDVGGATIAPGFVDIHTHYDAQLLWDGTASPSPLHGVTTVIGGNCGFGVAPLCGEAADYLARMLARVEGMPLESLQAGLSWDWGSFAEWLGRLESSLAVNAGFLVGHSSLRRVVMGEAAVGEPADERQLQNLTHALHEALAAGGLGFSSSRAPTHNDGDGSPVPSRFARDEELIALARTTGEHAGTTLEYIPTVGAFETAHLELMTAMSREANRPLNWNVLQPTATNPALHENQLVASDHAAAHGGRVLALTLPQAMELRLNLRSGFVLDALPGWAEIIALPLPERMRALADSAVRERLRKGASSPEAGVLGTLARWDRMVVCETFRPENRALAGRALREIAAELDRDPFDALLDLALSEELRTSFSPQMGGEDPATLRLRAEIWRDPRTVVGASDAGAHLDMIHTFTYTTWLLGVAVREHGLLTLEEAVHQLSDIPARLYGLRGRGRIEIGAWADLVVFDADRIGPEPPHTRSDLPGGAARLYAEARGIEHVLVQGTEIACAGHFTGERPGRVLRSGTDTETVTAH
ncbi:MAG: amidohydrolase family protein [Myxococcota bacterium]